LDSVLSGDLARLVAVFNSAKLIDAQLAKLMNSNGNNFSAARKYFAMHAALFALLVHAQDALIAKIDTNYLPKLDAIAKDIETARRKTGELLKAENRPDQRRTLEANRDSQKLADDAAKGYRRYLQQQREQIAAARKRAAHDLRIADNTYETVEASFQLRNLIRDSSSSFEAIQKLEAPTFEQIFKNEELRKEFENLTRKLDGPTS
jgi:ABC-type transporter Mla subunit MlaD